MVTYKVYFVPKAAGKEQYYIRMYVSLKRQGRHEFYLPIKCSVEEWNKGAPKSRKIQSALNSYKQMLEDVINRYDLLERRAPLKNYFHIS